MTFLLVLLAWPAASIVLGLGIGKAIAIANRRESGERRRDYMPAA